MRGLALLFAAVSAAAAETDPRATLEALRHPALDPARAIPIRGVELDLGTATLAIEDGVLVPAGAIDGRTTEVVFLGQARFQVTPPDAVEAQQLELFTGQRALDATIDRAVLAFGNTEAVARLLARPVVERLDEETGRQARELFERWIASAERKRFATDAGLWKSLAGDAGFAGYFAAWCHNEALGEFLYVLDPEEREQVVLGQFVPLETGDLDRARIERTIRKEQRHGRAAGLRFGDLGNWDTWLSTSLRAADGKATPGRRGFEPRRYTIDLSVVPADLAVRGRADIELEAVRAGGRSVELTLFSDLAVRSVRDAAGQELPWLRADSALHVILPSPPPAGGTVVLSVDYAGTLLDRFESGIFVLRDTLHWHPHAGSVDRALYDVTLRWPARLQLLASGRRAAGGRDGDEAWEQRTLDVPGIGFSFEVGDFEVTTERVGHVDLTVAFSKTTITEAKGAQLEAVATLRDALLFYERVFGTYPLDQLTVVTVPRGFSQGLPGFVTLSHALLAVRANPGASDWNRNESRRETIAHELAHQWWGNKLGWYDYRDQWLSEALASYSAVAYVAQRSVKPAVYLARRAGGWRGSIGGLAEGGETIGHLGPLVAGTRLFSSHSNSAYQAIVYDKGSVVLGMLARALGEQPFMEMLKSLADKAAGRAIDTATFLKSLERMSGVDLGEFAAQFVYGTTIPEIVYRYDVRPHSDGTWTVEGTADLAAEPRERHRLVRLASGNWDVVRQRAAEEAGPLLSLVVPFQVSLAGAANSREKARSRLTVAHGLGGLVALSGATSGFSIPLAERPSSFWLDQRGETFAWFHSEVHEPKAAHHVRGRRLARSGRPADAERELRLALAAPFRSAEALAMMEEAPDPKLLADRGRDIDAEAHMLLAGVLLDLGRDDEARDELDAAERLMRARPVFNALFAQRRLLRARPVYGAQVAERMIVQSRLDLRAGDYAAVFDRLRGNVRLDLHQRENESLSDALRRERFRGGWIVRAEVYAMLAAAARELGKEPIARRALEEAAERDVDVSALSATR